MMNDYVDFSHDIRVLENSSIECKHPIVKFTGRAVENDCIGPAKLKVFYLSFSEID